MHHPAYCLQKLLFATSSSDEPVLEEPTLVVTSPSPSGLADWDTASTFVETCADAPAATKTDDDDYTLYIILLIDA